MNIDDFDPPYVLPRAEQVDPMLRDKLQALATDFFTKTGEPLRITDSFRTYEEQADLKRRKPTLAAAPGKSKHEFGKALDVDQGQIEKFGLDNWTELLNTHGFERPALSKGETWHIELPRFEEAGKVAGGIDLSEFDKPRQEIDLSEFDKPEEFVETPASTLGGYEKLSKAPLEASVEPRAIVPAETMLAGEAAPFAPASGEELDVTSIGKPVFKGIEKAGEILSIPSNIAYKLGGEKLFNFLQSQSVDPEATKAASEILARGIGDILAYGVAGGLVKKVVDTGKAVSAMRQLNKAPALEELVMAKAVQSPSVPFKPGKAVLEKALTQEAPLKQGLVEAYFPEVKPTSLETLKNVPVHPAETKALSREAIANQEIINAAPTLWNREQLKWLRSGGPTSEEIINFVKNDISVNGASLTSVIGRAAQALKTSPETVYNTVKDMGQLSAGSLGNQGAARVQMSSQAFDAANKPMADNIAVTAKEFKQNLPSLRDVGLDVPQPPAHPGVIDPNGNIFPRKDVSAGATETLSPSIISGNLFGKNGPIHEWMGSWHRTLFEQAYYRRFLNNVFQDAGLMDDVLASQKAAEQVIGPLSRELEKATQSFARTQALLDQQKKTLSKMATDSLEAQNLTAKIKELGAIKPPEEIKTIHAKLEGVLKELEQQYSNIRIKRAADGNQESWNLLNPKEQEIATKLQEMYKQFGGRFKAQGVPTISGDYTNYVYHWGGYDTDQGMKAFANKMWWRKDNAPPDILTFLSREPGAKDWFPLAYQSADAYLGAATRKLAYNDWYKKWSPAIAQWKANGEFSGTANWLEGFLGRNMTPGEADVLDKVINGAVNFEYAHYLFGNFSPALLHLFKVAQVPAWHGFEAATKGLGGYAATLGGKTFGGAPNLSQRAVEYYVLSPQLIQALEQAPAWAGTFQPSFWQRLRGNPILNPTRLTEHFDRGVNVLSTIASGEKVGASANTIHDAILDAMMRLNFFGWDAPPLISKHRVLSMFQQQPTKLLEMKGQLIRDTLAGERDYYGQSHWPKLVRLAVILGGLYEGGQMMGLDLAKHVGAHIPFITDAMSGGHAAAVSPVIKAFSDFGPQGAGGGEFLKSWLSYGGTPQKLLQEEIPNRYNESRAQWLLGLPSSTWREEAGQLSESIQARKARRERGKESRARQRLTPYNALKDLLNE